MSTTSSLHYSQQQQHDDGGAFTKREQESSLSPLDEHNNKPETRKKKKSNSNSKKKKGGQKKNDDTQYEIQAIVGHGIGGKSKKVARLRIKWVGDTQTTLEKVTVIKETAWEMVEIYAKKKNITI